MSKNTWRTMVGALDRMIDALETCNLDEHKAGELLAKALEPMSHALEPNDVVHARYLANCGTSYLSARLGLNWRGEHQDAADEARVSVLGTQGG